MLGPNTVGAGCQSTTPSRAISAPHSEFPSDSTPISLLSVRSEGTRTREYMLPLTLSDLVKPCPQSLSNGTRIPEASRRKGCERLGQAVKAPTPLRAISAPQTPHPLPGRRKQHLCLAQQNGSDPGLLALFHTTPGLQLVIIKPYCRRPVASRTSCPDS